ncbi:hypothetical protein EKO04_005825 [Ascochyta lentis]|uniref:Uncharacterized protein n=1 Tax=Ascochyta lentis TaxID=205686 RepID=A0A8H7J018_9PLEO|nr:hypothetical protein EKO04_005825 [Ascochyta lentis]
MAHSGYHPLYDGPLFESADTIFFDFDASEGSGSQPGTGGPVFDTPQINVTSDYNRAIAFMDCATAQYSDSSHGHRNTGESLLSRNTEANFEYTVSSLDEGPAQAVAEFQAFETVATFPAVQGRTAADFGLTFNSQVTHNSSCTWQPAGSHEEYPTDSSSGYIVTPGPTEVTDTDEGHHHTGLHQLSSVRTAYDGPPKYSTQIDSDLAGLSLHPPASDMVDPQGGMLLPLLQDGPTMERSFPPYMYTAESNLLGGPDTHLFGSPISVFVSCDRAIEGLAGEQGLHSDVPSRSVIPLSPICLY